MKKHSSKRKETYMSKADEMKVLELLDTFFLSRTSGDIVYLADYKKAKKQEPSESSSTTNEGKTSEDSKRGV